MSGDPEMLWNVVDDQYRNANLVFQLKKDDSRTLETALHAVEAHQPRLAELGVSMHFAGSGYKSLVFAGLILDGQILSLMLSFLIVFVLLALMFRKISAGLIGTLPILLTAIVGFGVMGAFGIALSTTTALISSIAVGVGIDYAVHFLERYRKLAATANNRELAGRDTISHSGRAILFNALVVVAGFLVLLFSVFPPNRQLGGLVSLNMLTSFVFTISAMYVLLLMSGLWFQGKGVRP
jgi:hypothetical protein